MYNYNDRRRFDSTHTDTKKFCLKSNLSRDHDQEPEINRKIPTYLKEGTNKQQSAQPIYQQQY